MDERTSPGWIRGGDDGRPVVLVDDAALLVTGGAGVFLQLGTATAEVCGAIGSARADAWGDHPPSRRKRGGLCRRPPDQLHATDSGAGSCLGPAVRRAGSPDPDGAQ